MTTRPTPGVLAPTTAAVVERLKSGKSGDVVTEAEMTQVLHQSCSPMTPGYAIVYRATQHVLKEYHLSWRRDRSVSGWRCETPKERIDRVRDSGTKQARRLASKHLRLLAVPTESLSPEDRRDQQLLQVVHGLIYTETTGRFRQQIISQVADHRQLAKPSAVALIELMRTDGK